MAQRLVAPIGANSILAFGLQPDAETPVKATSTAEYRNGGFDATRGVLYSEANKDTPSPRTGKAVSGDFEGSGQWTAELTPKRHVPLMLTGLFGAPSEIVLSPDAVNNITMVVTGSVGTKNRSYFVVARKGKYPSTVTTSGNAATYPALSNANYVTVTWNAVAGATSYDILCQTKAANETGDYTKAIKIGTVNAPTVSFVHNKEGGRPYKVTMAKFTKKSWTHTWDWRYLTAHQKKGNAVFTFPFVLMHSMAIRLDRGQREVMLVDFGAKAADMWTVTEPNASIGEDGDVASALGYTGISDAMYDDHVPFSPAKAAVKISETGGNLLAATKIKGFNLNFDRNTTDQYILNGKLGPYSFIHGISALDVTYDAYFESGAEFDLRLFMGHASDVAPTFPYAFTDDIKTVSSSVLFEYPSGHGCNSSFEAIFPNCAYGAVGQPVGGRGEPLMQSVKVEPMYSSDYKTDMVIEIVSNESAQSILYEGDADIDWLEGPDENAVQHYTNGNNVAFGDNPTGGSGGNGSAASEQQATGTSSNAG